MIFTLWAAAALAQDEASWGEGAEVDTNARYVWRGIDFSSGPVVQPSAWLWFGGGELSLWTSLPIQDNSDFELDPAFAWTFETEHISIVPSVTGYFLPGVGNTAEVGLELDVPLGPISIVTTHALDVWGSKGGWYGTLGAGVEHALGETLSLDAKAEVAACNAGFTRYNLGIEHAGLHGINAGAGLTFAPNLFYVRLHGELSALLNSEAATANGRQVPWNVGLAIGIDN